MFKEKIWNEDENSEGGREYQAGASNLAKPILSENPKPFVLQST